MDYTMVQPNAEIRACSRDQLKGVWGKMAFTFFVYGLIFTPLSIISFFNALHELIPAVPAFTEIYYILLIVTFVVSGPFYLGFCGYFIKRIRGQEISLGNIFDGFQRIIPSFVLMFFMNIFTFLWSLLLIVPGIIKALGYSMAFYIMYDNPEIKPFDALKKSQEMMKGYKGKFLLLYLSFIGWAILASLTFGIGYLWLAPYVYISQANFYENVKQIQGRTL